MKTVSRVVVAALSTGVLGTAVFGSAPNAAPASSESSAGSAPRAAAAVPLAQHPGKILAGNCFQCHGTDGKGGPFEGIAGESANELFSELKELQTDTDPEKAIMRVHALADTDAQLRLIAAYFAQVPGGGN